MVFIIVLSVILVVAFFMCISAYTIGLKHGKQLSSNNIPKVNLNPVKPIINAVKEQEQKKEEKKATEDLDEIFSYNIDTAMQAIKKEKAGS